MNIPTDCKGNLKLNELEHMAENEICRDPENNKFPFNARNSDEKNQAVEYFESQHSYKLEVEENGNNYKIVVSANI